MAGQAPLAAAVVAALYVTLSRKIDRVERRIDALERRAELVERHVGAVERQTGEVGKRLDAIDARVSAVERHVVEIRGRLDAVEKHMGEVRGRLDALDARVSAVEKQAAAIGGRLDTLEARVSAVEKQTVEMRGRLDAIEAQVSEVRRRLDEIAGRVESLASDAKLMARALGLFNTALLEMLSSKGALSEAEVRALRGYLSFTPRAASRYYTEEVRRRIAEILRAFDEGRITAAEVVELQQIAKLIEMEWRETGREDLLDYYVKLVMFIAVLRGRLYAEGKLPPEEFSRPWL
jgi:chromosome segregation ATPase